MGFWNTFFERRGVTSEPASRETSTQSSSLSPTKTTEALIEGLANDHNYSSIEELVRLGSGAVEPLLEALGHRDWRIRRWSLEVLGDIGDPQALDAIIAVLDQTGVRDEKHVILCRVAAAALRNFTDPRSIAALTAATGHPDEDVRMRAAESLSSFSDPKLLAVHLRSLGDEAVGVRSAAVDALVRIGQPAVPQLVEAVKSTDSHVQWGAAVALSRLGVTPIPFSKPQSYGTFRISSWEIAEDLSTDLQWQRIDSEARFTWDDAHKYCRDLRCGGFADWRLPEIQEFFSLRNGVSVLPEVFPQLQGEHYWSATLHKGTNQLIPWTLTFMWDEHGHRPRDVDVQTYFKTYEYPVKAVRGSAKAGSLKSLREIQDDMAAKIFGRR